MEALEPTKTQKLLHKNEQGVPVSRGFLPALERKWKRSPLHCGLSAADRTGGVSQHMLIFCMT